LLQELGLAGVQTPASLPPVPAAPPTGLTIALGRSPAPAPVPMPFYVPTLRPPSPTGAGSTPSGADSTADTAFSYLPPASLWSKASPVPAAAVHPARAVVAVCERHRASGGYDIHVPLNASHDPSALMLIPWGPATRPGANTSGGQPEDTTTPTEMTDTSATPQRYTLSLIATGHNLGGLSETVAVACGGGNRVQVRCEALSTDSQLMVVNTKHPTIALQWIKFLCPRLPPGCVLIPNILSWEVREKVASCSGCLQALLATSTALRWSLGPALPPATTGASPPSQAYIGYLQERLRYLEACCAVVGAVDLAVLDALL